MRIYVAYIITLYDFPSLEILDMEDKHLII